MLRIYLTFVCIFSSWYVMSQDLSPYITENGTVHFSSDAPLEFIKATSNELHGVIDPVKNIFCFHLEIVSFKGFNSLEQQVHFNENHMESDHFQIAFFSGKIIEDVDLTEDGLYFIRAKGKLEIHGVKQERIIKGTVEVVDSKIHVRTRFTVLPEEYDIRLPRIVYQKIAKEIVVEINAELIRPRL